MALHFRKTGIQIPYKGRLLFLLGVFLISFIVFYIVLNINVTPITKIEAKSSLPVVSVRVLDCRIGQYFGYTVEMEDSYMRKDIIPINKDRKLGIIVDLYGNTIKSLKYEIRSLDSERKIAETPIKDITVENNQILADVQLENLVMEGTEYTMILTLETEERPIYYYMHILLPENANEKECLDFARYFHDTSLTEQYIDLATYIEPKEQAPKGFSNVTIHSKLNQIGWKGFAGSVVAEPVISFKEINESYCTLQMLYQMRKETGGDERIYNVVETIRTRKGAQRMFLLDYTRKMEEILNPDTITSDKQILRLGSASEIPEYISNEKGTIMGFVWAGALFEYNSETEALIRVFDFRGEEFTDPRSNAAEHAIHILRIDETGSMDFAVYGYMNSGEHEGECGINLFHYDNETIETEEEAYISSTRPYQVLRAGFKGTMYRSAQNRLYLLYDDELITNDLSENHSQVVHSPKVGETIAISESGRFAAWSANENNEVIIMDLNDETRRTMNVESGEKVRILTFLEEDLVYGLYDENDTVLDATGNVHYPLRKVIVKSISKEEDEVLKTYEKSGQYIWKIDKESSHSLSLQLAAKEGDGYLMRETDSIQNTMREGGVVTAEQLVSDDDTVTEFMFHRMKESQKPKVATVKDAQMNVLVEHIQFAMPNTEKEEYFVYAGDEIIATGTELLSLMDIADERKGYILDKGQTYIWQYGRRAASEPLTNLLTSDNTWDRSPEEECLNIMLNYEGVTADRGQLLSEGRTELAVLRQELSDAVVLNLTGAKLSQVLSYISRGYPVYAKTGSGECYLLVGYDATALVVFDPISDKKIRKNLNDMTAQFEQGGNVFYTYVKKY